MTEKVFLQTFLYVWIYIIVGTVLFFVFGNYDFALAFFVGSITSVMLMSHNYKTTMKAAYKEPETLKIRSIKNYIFRFIFYLIIISFVYFREHNVYHIIPVFLGLSAFKIVMVANFFIQRKGVNKDD